MSEMIEKMVEGSYCVGAVVVRTVNKAKVYQATYHMYLASVERRLYTQSVERVNSSMICKILPIHFLIM